MQKVFQESDTVILDSKTGGVVPYLPLNELLRQGKSPSTSGSSTSSSSSSGASQ